MWIDILMVVLWVFAVWVCIYDWEWMDDGDELGPETDVEGKNVAKSWQNRGKTGFKKIHSHFLAKKSLFCDRFTRKTGKKK